ncbi:MmgE/PrpD family protein [Rhizomonospora bruguierae]|uniref:MmgE/PrpD family protein n=1 Tax=Rhizomonospora bruguierae TaxID=1581705 RepID=UPI001BCE921F|nr:MmgE/PrpD family protein [Micromonospora sp. NBRC 107566]
MTKISHLFAAWAGRLRPSDLPEEVRDRITLRVADAVGLVAAAWDTPPGKAVRDLAAELSGSGRALLFDPRPLHPASSALAHGTLVHALDYDDTFPESVIHPMSVLLPAALAAADDERAGGEVVAALAAGDELLARLGAAAGRRLHAHGFQATSVFGPLAAALVVGVLRGRSPATVASAMGLAGSFSGGLLEFLSDGTWSKRLHPGWAAHGGVIADGLAARNFPGPASIVEGRHGLFTAFLGDEVDPAQVTEGLGERWLSATAQIKLYPCAHVLHPFIVMAHDLRHRDVRVSDITEIVCGVAPWYVPIVCEPLAEKLNPVGEYQARTSLPLVVALGLLDEDVDSDSFEPVSVGRPELRALAAKVRYVADPQLTEGFGARLRVVTADRTFDGDPWLTVDVPDRVRRKFLAATARGAAAGVTPAEPAEALWAVARRLDQHPMGVLRRAALSLAGYWEGRHG